MQEPDLNLKFVMAEYWIQLFRLIDIIILYYSF